MNRFPNSSNWSLSLWERLRKSFSKKNLIFFIICVSLTIPLTSNATPILETKNEHKKTAPLTKAEKTKIIVTKARPHKTIKRTKDPYKYLRSILEKRPLYYRERYRKKGRYDRKLYSNIQETRKEQKFVQPYTPAKHLQNKRYFPNKRFIHYRELYRFGQRTDKMKSYKNNQSRNRSQ